MRTRALYLLGVLCGRSHRVAEGIDLLGRACSLSPQLAGYWLQLGACCARQASLRTRCCRGLYAKWRFQQIELQHRPTRNNNLGNALVDQRKYAQAAEAYPRPAVSLDARMDIAPSATLGSSLQELGELGHAIAWRSRKPSRSIQIPPLPTTCMGLALFRDRGQFDAAIAAHARGD